MVIISTNVTFIEQNSLNMLMTHSSQPTYKEGRNLQLKLGIEDKK